MAIVGPGGGGGGPPTGAAGGVLAAEYPNPGLSSLGTLFGTAYGAPTARTTGVEWLPSASKWVLVMIQVTAVSVTGSNVTCTVGGSIAFDNKLKLTAAEKLVFPVLVPPNTKMKVEMTELNHTVVTRELV